MEIEYCPVCNSKYREKLVEIEIEKFFGDEFKPITIEKSICNSCGHIYANRYYDTTKHYEITRSSTDELIYYNEDVDKMFMNLVTWAKILTNLYTKKIESILDIGCGKCDLLKQLEKRYKTATIQGIDHSSESKRFGDEYGINVLVGKFEDAFQGQKFDLITLTGVLEHQFYIEAFIEKLIKLCNNETMVLIEVPNSYNIIEYNDNKFMHDIYNDEHVHHFNLHTLCQLMENYGFIMLDNKTVNRDDWDVLDVMFVRSNIVKTNTINEKFKNKTSSKLFNLYAKIKGQNSIALYGAGWHTQSLIKSFYNIENIDAIYDRDIRKQGLKLLGKLVQYPTKELLMQHDCILISTMSKDLEIEQELIDMGIPKSKIVRMY